MIASASAQWHGGASGTSDGSAARHDERGRVLELLRRHGWNATSFQVLGRGFRYWFDGDDACVAYADTGGAWVVAGSPMAAPARLGEVARRFVEHGRAQGRRVCFFATEARFAGAFPPRALATLSVGEQPVWDPAAWESTLRESKSLREQLRRARAKGVTVRAVEAAEIADADAPARQAIEALIARWLASRAMAPMGFLVDVQPFGFPAERRYLVAEQGGRVVGFLAAVPVYARQGWFFEHLLRDGAAPNGTAELLVDAGMRRAAAEGSRYVTLGLAPLAGEVGQALGLARAWLTALYDFRGLHAFKARLRPRSWEPIYVARLADGPGAIVLGVALYDTLAAFARGSFVRFGFQTALRALAAVTARSQLAPSSSRTLRPGSSR